MNRKGFTAIMDAVIFIVILSLAVSAISHMHDERTQDDSALYESCDILMHYRLYPSHLGYATEDRDMLFSDLWALSITASDEKGTAVAGKYLSGIFPQGDVGLEVEYGGKTEYVNYSGEGWTQSATRSYAVEYGDEITLTLYRK